MFTVIGWRLKEEYRVVADKLVETLRNFFGERLVSVVVFGSVARGEAKADSDFDVLVVAEGLPESRMRRQEIFMQAENEIQDLLEGLRREGVVVDFSPILLTPEEASKIRPLYLDLVHDALILFDRNGFFTSILNRLRRRLEEMGAKRVKRGRLWYWDLKPGMMFGEVIEIE